MYRLFGKGNLQAGHSASFSSYFGGRNHSTAVAAEKKVRTWLAKSAEMVVGERRLGAKEAIELIERELLR